MNISLRMKDNVLELRVGYFARVISRKLALEISEALRSGAYAYEGEATLIPEGETDYKIDQRWVIATPNDPPGGVYPQLGGR